MANNMSEYGVPSLPGSGPEQPSMFGEEHRKVTRRHELKPGDTFCYAPDRARFTLDERDIDKHMGCYYKPRRDAAVYAAVPALTTPVPVEGLESVDLASIEFAALMEARAAANRVDALSRASRSADDGKATAWGGRDALPACRLAWSAAVRAKLAANAATVRAEVTCQPNYVED